MPDFKSVGTQAALKIAEPLLEKVLEEEKPIRSPLTKSFPTLKTLPDGEFQFASIHQKSIEVDQKGNLFLSPGDYTIPVVTYCMKFGGRSPSGYSYELNRIQGSRETIFQEINQHAFPKFQPDEVQLLSWTLQSGVSYEEIGSRSRRALDETSPRAKKDLQESLLNKIQKNWDSVAEKSNGYFPYFEDASYEYLDQLGTVGKKIKELKHWRALIEDSEDDFSNLKHLVDVSEEMKPTSPVWSRASEQVYARFVTEGHFLDAGVLQIRVLPNHKKRKPSSAVADKTLVNIHSWVADPKDLTIQPLSFSSLVLSGGVFYEVNAVLDSPLVVSALIAAVLSYDQIDWGAFFHLRDQLSGSLNERVRKIIQEGNLILNEKFDELEKPAKDVGIINKNTKKGKETKDHSRQYEKEGGNEQLQKDFDQFDAENEKTSDGKDLKQLPNGSKVVKRPKEGNADATLEIQAPEGKLKIKVRYK